MLRGARHQARARKKISFGINVILPVQSHLEKYSASRLTQITSISAPFHPMEGRIMIVTDAGWDAVDAAAFLRAMGSQGGSLSTCERSTAGSTRDAFADGEVVWS
jgi:hypothetical protein